MEFETLEGFLYFKDLKHLTMRLKNTAELLGTLILSNVDNFELQSPVIPKYLMTTHTNTLYASIWKI